MEKYWQFHALRSIHQLILTFKNEFGLGLFLKFLGLRAAADDKVVINLFGDCDVQHKSLSIKHLSHQHHYL